MNRKPITILNHPFASIKQATEYFNISRPALLRRLKKYGPNNPKILQSPQPNYHSVVIDGHHFKSIRDACNYYDADYRLACNRIYSGKDPNDLKTYTTPAYPSQQQVVYKKLTYPTIKSLSKTTGISAYQIRNALSNGINLNTLKKSKPQQFKNGFTYQGTHYNSIKQAAELHHLKPSTLYSRINQPNALKKDDLFCHPDSKQPNAKSKQPAKNIKYPKISYEQAQQLAKRYHAPISNFYQAEKNMQTSSVKKHQSHRATPKVTTNKTIEYRGHTFPSITAMAKYYHMATSTLSAHLIRYPKDDPRIIQNMSHTSHEYEAVNYQQPNQ